MSEQSPIEAQGPSHQDLLEATSQARESAMQSGDYFRASGTKSIGDAVSKDAYIEVDDRVRRGMVSAEVRVPTSEGNAQYKTLVEADRSEFDPDTGDREAVDGYANTTIVRHDSAGNEVYRFKSNNPRLARQAGIVAARAVVRRAA